MVEKLNNQQSTIVEKAVKEVKTQAVDAHKTGKSVIQSAKKIKVPKGKNGGARPGSGRKKGGMNPATIEKIRTIEEYKDRVRKNADKLYNAQITLALGSVAVYLVESYEDSHGKERTRKVLVEDKQTIENILNDPDMIQGENYYAVTIIPPNPQVIDSMMDRTYGKATQVINADINSNVTLSSVLNELKNVSN